MAAAPLPANEMQRLIALRAHEQLDDAAQSLLDDAVRLAAFVSRSPVALVSFVGADRQHLRARHGLDIPETPRDVAFCAHAILQPGEPLAVEDATRDDRFADNPLVTGELGIRAYLGVPLVTPQGHALGTLCVIDKVPRRHESEVVEALRRLARTVAAVLEMQRAMREAGRFARTDPLTGLPNRSAFLDGLSRALARQRRDGRPFSLLYLDLDGFKAVNDQRGHAEGDRVLVQVADAMAECVRREDLVARLSGDEFAVLMQGGDGAEVPRAGERLRTAVQARMRALGLGVTVSIGGMCFPLPPLTESDALAAVDRLMLAAKAAGRNRLVTAPTMAGPVVVEAGGRAEETAPA